MSFTVFTETASALSFGTELNLSMSDALSASHAIQASGENIAVVFTDSDSGSGTIMVTYSTNLGSNFTSVMAVSIDGHSSTSARFVSVDNSLFLVWVDSDIGNSDIFFRKGTIETDGSLVLEEPVNVSDTNTPSGDPRIAVVDDDVYVIWEEDISDGGGVNEVYFAANLDGDDIFEIQRNLSNSDFIYSQDPQIVALSGTDLYVTWVEDDIDGSGIGDVYFVKGIASADDVSFSGELNLSENIGGSAFTPRITMSGAAIYLIWADRVYGDIYFASSVDSGLNFDTPAGVSDNLSGSSLATQPEIFASSDSVYCIWIDAGVGSGDVMFSKGDLSGDVVVFGSSRNISNSTSSFSSSAQLAVLDANVQIVWQEGTPNDVFFSSSQDDGSEFSEPVNLSSNSGISRTPQMNLLVSKTFIIWQDNTPANFDIFFRSLSDTGPPSITLELTSTISPKWGIDPVQVGGLVNGNASDTIRIDWGDGSPLSDVAVSGSSWLSDEYTYDSDGTGTRLITASLVDDLDIVKASDTREIDVQKHATSLTIDSISSVIQGNDITANGLLMDSDTSTPIPNRNITFDGSGSIGILTTITAGDGSYTSTGASPSSAAELLIVEAIFAGDAGYDPSSAITTYDTVATGTDEFTVPAGSPSGPIDLTGFNASIVFDDVVSEGTVFVSTCQSPTSSRYEVVIDDLCLKISSAIELASDSRAHITISYQDRVIPSDHDAAEIRIFQEKDFGIVDITESRSTQFLTVTGNTAGFSKFIVADALHDLTPGAISQEVFVGNNNLSFEFPPSNTSLINVSLDKSGYSVGENAILSITDPSRNVDNSAIESIKANVSSSSDPAGIKVTLSETGFDTGIFSGSFSVVGSGPSSTSEAKLRIIEGDEINANYDAYTKSPFRVSLSDVLEAGIAELIAYEAPPFMNPVSDGYELIMTDTVLGDNSTIAVTMSYSNAGDLPLDPSELRIFRMTDLVCREDISPSGTSGHNFVEETVNGTVGIPGQYTLSFPGAAAPETCPADPGGGGGGIPRPGTGIILLDSARGIGADDTEQTRNSGGGGGGSSRSTAVVTTASGSDVETSVTTDSGTVSIIFESIQEGSGQLRVNSNELASFEEFFDEVAFLSQDNDERGVVRLDDMTYSTAGKVFDIDDSFVNYDGSVIVTIPYDEDIVEAFSQPETDVRFIHYNESSDTWEDMTSGVDVDSNTVTGTLTSLSPVVAAIILDNTDVSISGLPSNIHVEIPKFAITEDGQLAISASLRNSNTALQKYVLIVQLVDQQGIVQHLDYEENSLQPGQDTTISRSWSQMEHGEYKVQIFLLTDLENPWLLSQAEAELSN